MRAVALPTRDHLVATARQLLDAEGLEPLTLREIARRGGVSHGAPLRHFPSLAALMAAVAAAGFRDLITSVDAAVAEAAPDATALDRLAAAGRGYVRFASGSPGVFALMFHPDRVDVATTPTIVKPARRRSASSWGWSRPRSATASGPTFPPPGSPRPCGPRCTACRSSQLQGALGGRRRRGARARPSIS